MVETSRHHFFLSSVVSALPRKKANNVSALNREIELSCSNRTWCWKIQNLYVQSRSFWKVLDAWLFHTSVPVEIERSAILSHPFILLPAINTMMMMMIRCIGIALLCQYASAFVATSSSGSSSSSSLSAVEPQKEIGVLPPVGFFEWVLHILWLFDSFV